MTRSHNLPSLPPSLPPSLAGLARHLRPDDDATRGLQQQHQLLFQKGVAVVEREHENSDVHDWAWLVLLLYRHGKGGREEGEGGREGGKEERTCISALFACIESWHADRRHVKYDAHILPLPLPPPFFLRSSSASGSRPCTLSSASSSAFWAC